MAFQNFLTIGINFAMKYGRQSGLLETKIKTAYACEERAKAHLITNSEALSKI